MTASVRAASAIVVAAVALAIAGCAPEPEAPPTSAALATPSSSSPASAADPSASPTSAPAFALPAGCEAVYSAAMLGTLQSQMPPLNDPGVTLFSTQNSTALELLDSGIPTLRCSWGAPSEFGLATNVSVIDAAQSQSVQDALANEGIACEPAFDGTLCTAERETIDQDDNLVTTGEQHFFRDDGWVSTAYVDVLPEGYTQDVAATLWG